MVPFNREIIQISLFFYIEKIKSKPFDTYLVSHDFKKVEFSELFAYFLRFIELIPFGNKIKRKCFKFLA